MQIRDSDTVLDLDHVSDCVLRALARKTGLSVEDIRPESRLFHDLGLGGDDAAELLDAFERDFTVDMSEFDFSTYFPSEPNLFSIFVSPGPKKELTVQALIQGVANRKLVG